MVTPPAIYRPGRICTTLSYPSFSTIETTQLYGRDSLNVMSTHSQVIEESKEGYNSTLNVEITPNNGVSTNEIQNPATPNNLAVATGGYIFPGIPKIDDPYKRRQWQLEHMAGAFRVFARKSYTEGTSGHISVRDPVDPDTFWINP